jgi:glycosyltransferase involved in cell wall biosynthesis
VSSEEKWDLLVSLHTPTLGTGRAMRTYGIARALATNGRLKLLYVPFGAPQPDPAFVAAGIELHEVSPSRDAKRLLAFAKARMRGVPPDFARGVSPELAHAAKRLARDERCARVIADGPTAAATLLPLARERPVIYNAHNLESGFRHELDGKRGLRGLADFERKLLSSASESWMVSAPDMEAAHELCLAANLRLVPNVVDVAAITPVAVPTPEPRALFVANFSYEPNRNALRFLLTEVMPLVWEQLPQAQLTLVGGSLREALYGEGLADTASDPRIEALGFVEDLANAYGRARCAVVPLLQGGGTPLKLLEALAYGLPTLTTPRAGHALGLRDGVDCLFADGAHPFAEALVSVLRDGAPQLGAAARMVAEERYSVRALARILSS